MVLLAVPVSTDLLADYPSNRWAVVLYGCNIEALGLTLYGQWWYATHRGRLVGPHLEPDLVKKGKMRIMRGLLLYAVAILIAFLSLVVSLVLYGRIPIGSILPG